MNKQTSTNFYNDFMVNSGITINTPEDTKRKNKEINDNDNFINSRS